MWLEQRPQVDTLRIRGADADVPALRLAVAGRLQTAELELPSSAPPSAILLIRRFGDPLPGRFPRAGAPRVDRDWNRAAASDLAGFYRIASRPVRGELPPDASAVVFQDGSDFLATALLYLARGAPPRAWWWRSLVRLLPSGALESVGRLLAHSPREAPAALTRIFQQHREALVLTSLSRFEARAALAAVIEAFGLGPVAAEFARTRQRPPARQTDRGLLAETPSEATPQGPVRELVSGPPWQDWLPAERTRSLEPDQEILLATALGLRRACHAVRRETYWRAAAEWRSVRGRAPRLPEPTWGLSPPRSAAEPQTPPEQLSDPARTAPEPARPQLLSVEPAARDSWPGMSHPIEPRRDAHPAPVSSKAPAEPLTRPASHPSESAVEPTELESSAPAPDSAHIEGQAWTDPAVETGLAGAFYLVHVMTSLGLPEIFQDDWHLASRLGGWGTLDVLARLLASELGPDAVADPLWALLARLDGREPETPPRLAIDTDARAISPFAIPADWRGESQPAGSPNQPDFEHPLLVGLDRRLRAWLSGVAPWVGHSLALASGVREVRQLAELLRLRARIFATATHVDIVAPLSEISLTARRAGLDRDPGWVPILGRVVTFHFR